MLKGLMLTPPIIGRIAIGKVAQKNGNRLPEKDDQFTITTNVQNKDGWILHPIDATLRAKQDAKLRSIPVRLLFNDPDLNLRANYTMFERGTGRPICVGNGDMCKRVTSSGIQKLPCPSPEACALSVDGRCKPFGRLNVRIGDDDELGSFIFRTTGFNSIRTLATRLRYFDAISGGMLSTMPLELKLRAKSTTQSRRSTIYFVDITTRSGMTVADTLNAAKAENRERNNLGYDQSALDQIARSGFYSGNFEDSPDEGKEVADEFFSPDTEKETNEVPENKSLMEKLRMRPLHNP